MAVTMQQVAELAGVSRGTVDRVLHGRPNVDAVVREKVLRAAEKLGYSCKKTASAPRHRAAILIPQWTDTYFNRQVISGIRRALRYIADDSFELLEVPLRTMLIVIGVVVALGLVGIFGSSYRRDRLMVFMNPWNDGEGGFGTGFQLIH